MDFKPLYGRIDKDIIKDLKKKISNKKKINKYKVCRFEAFSKKVSFFVRNRWTMNKKEETKTRNKKRELFLKDLFIS